MLRRWSSLDDFLGSSKPTCMFWFFQRSEVFLSQRTTAKWDRDRLDDYVLLPAMPGFVTRGECTLISHFWRTRNDPGDEFLRRQQEGVRSNPCSYVWIDWSCMPQHPRSVKEDTYFRRALPTIPAIVRNAGFVCFYPPFQPRLWILYEVTEYFLTCLDGFEHIDEEDPDLAPMAPFRHHYNEMLREGVQPVLAKYGYRASVDRDTEYLLSWLDLIVLLTRVDVGLFDVRELLDRLTWEPSSGNIIHRTMGDAVIRLRRWDGTLAIDERVHTFKPFPTLVCGLGL